jgi:epoxyqueuosine reductase
MVSLKETIKDMAKNLKFNSIGITTPEDLEDLKYGWVYDVRNLRKAREVLPTTKSIILLTFHVWDPTFMLQLESPNWKGYSVNTPGEDVEGYYIAYQVTQNKAWNIVSLLREHGYDAVLTTDLPMKKVAVKCGLGCQGKNTLLVTEEVGPRVALVCILTSAELEPDHKEAKNPCEDCDICVKACPTGALTPYKIDHMKCLTYASENPGRTDFSPEIREIERKLVRRPSPHSYVECSICMYACPVGKIVNV